MKQLEELPDVNVVERYIHGPLAGLKSTSNDLNKGDLKVLSFCDNLDDISQLLAARIKESCPSADVDFNFLEIKLYLGGDMFTGISDDSGTHLHPTLARKCS